MWYSIYRQKSKRLSFRVIRKEFNENSCTHPPGALNAENADLKAENTDLKAENTDLKAENTDLKVENTDLKVENTDLKAENTDLKAENTDLKAENAENVDRQNYQTAIQNSICNDFIIYIYIKLKLMKLVGGKGGPLTPFAAAGYHHELSFSPLVSQFLIFRA
eukprot:sb/3472703/